MDLPEPDEKSRSRATGLSVGNDSDVATRKSDNLGEQSLEKHWTILSEGFPPGVTVDELKHYRRKRPQNLNPPSDNLQIGNGTLQSIKTEYKRSFPVLPIHPEPTPRIKRESTIFFITNNKENYAPKDKTTGHIFWDKSGDMSFVTEKNQTYVPFSNVVRTRPVRGPTALRLEGDLITETESKRHFVPHQRLEKTKPARRASTLRLEGAFESLTSEQKEKYCAFLEAKRRNLEKRHTNLMLEGGMDFITEKYSKYVPHVQVERSQLRKRSTSLKLDGEVDYSGEYANNYVDFPRHRPHVQKPIDNLHYGGDLDSQTEMRTKYKTFDHVRDFSNYKMRDNIRIEGEVNFHPEYKTSYTNLPRSRPEVIKPVGHLRTEGEFENRTESRAQFINFHNMPTPSFIRKPDNIRLEGDINLNPEYRERFSYTLPDKTLGFVDFSKHQARSIKPRGNLAVGGTIETETEKRQMFKNFGTIPKTTSKKNPGNLKLEGELEKEPEYRRQFIEHSVKVERSPKPVDNLNFESFQIVNCKDLPEAPLKPPEPLLSTSSIASSPSPVRQKFRMDVQNVDEKPIGFHRNRQRIFPDEALNNLDNFVKKDENGNDRAFTVISNANGNTSEGEPKIWTNTTPWMNAIA